MPTLQRRQSPLQNSPYCLVSEFEGEQPEGEESRPNRPLSNRRCPLPFSQTKWWVENGCVPIPRTHPSKAAFEGCVDADCVTATRQVLSQFQGSFKCGLRMQPSFPGFEGCIGCILHGPTYPKILHGPTHPSQDSLRIQSMEMAENGDLSSAFKCKYWVSSHSSI